MIFYGVICYVKEKFWIDNYCNNSIFFVIVLSFTQNTNNVEIYYLVLIYFNRRICLGLYKHALSIQSYMKQSSGVVLNSELCLRVPF